MFSQPDLNEFIHKILSIQSDPKSRVGGSETSMSSPSIQITTYDVVYIQSFLVNLGNL